MEITQDIGLMATEKSYTGGGCVCMCVHKEHFYLKNSITTVQP